MRPSSWIGTLAASALVAALVGCGGAGGDTQATNPPAETINTKEQATARVDVDLASGAVKVTPMDPRQGSSLLTGSAVAISSSAVFTEPGEITLKKLKLSIKNNTGESIGGATGAMLVVDRLATDDLGAVNLREFSNVGTVIGPGSSPNDGPGSAVTITQPSGVDMDTDGTLYVAGQGDGTLRKMKDNLVTRIATGLATPGGVAALPGTDFAFITEQSTHNIVRVPKSGGAKFLIAGGGATGLVDGVGSAARFNLPRDILISGTTAFVADYNNDRIRKLTNLTGSAATVATLPVAPVITKPSGLAMSNLNGVDYLVVCSTQTHKVFIVNAATGASYQIAGTGVSGSADGLGSVASFNQPSDVAVVGQAIFVTEIGNRTIRQIMLKPGAEPKFASSWVVKTLAGSGVSGAIDGQGTVAQFASPRYLAADKSGALYATDLTNNRVRRITGVSGTLPITGTGGTGGNVEVANPDRYIPSPDLQTGRKAVYDIPNLGPSGSPTDSANQDIEFTLTGSSTSFYFFVSILGDTDSVASLDAVSNASAPLKGSINVNVRTLTGKSEVGTADGDPMHALFDAPRAIRAGNAIYVACYSSGTIRRYDMTTHITSTIAGAASTGSIIMGSGTSSSLPTAAGMWMNDAEDEGYVALGGGNCIVRLSRSSGVPSDSDDWTVSLIAGSISTSGNIVGTGDLARFNNVRGLVAEPSGAVLYVADLGNNNIKRLTFIGGGNRNVPTGWSVQFFAGADDGSPGDADGLGIFARFKSPFGLALAKDGTLYVSEETGYRIRRITPDKNVTLVAGSPTGVSGAADGVGAAARFNVPDSITLDNAGFLYVGDYANEVIRRINIATGDVRTVAGQSNVSALTDGSGATAAILAPYSVNFAPGEGLYIADNSTIRLIERVVRQGSP
jgi:sugar lactone lactonase YvrE